MDTAQEETQVKEQVEQQDGYTNSRLIIKNLPKHLTEDRMREHFKNNGEFVVTDVKIMRKGNKSRQFGFVGFKNDRHAKQAKKFFDATYIDTSKVEIDFAKQQGDETIPRAWSRYHQDSSAYQLTHKDDQKKINKK